MDTQEHKQREENMGVHGRCRAITLKFETRWELNLRASVVGEIPQWNLLWVYKVTATVE